ncbi:MAG: response regulator [Vampirovibrionales bacterium]|nr:response regulator [Vampirovibrionales bacterium]
MTSDCGSLVTGSVIPLNIAPNAFLTSEKQATALVIGAMGYINVQIKSALRRLGYDIVLAENVEDVGQLITNHDYQYVILDLNIPTPHEGLRMLDDLKKSAILHDLSFKIIAMSCGGSCAHLQQEAVGRGADQFLWRENDWQNRLSRFIEAAR